MKCYTITETAERGITVGQEGLRVGELRAQSVLPLSKGLLSAMEERAEHIAEADKGDPWFSEDPEHVTLNSADLSDRGDLRLIKDRGGKGPCLVLLATCAPVGGSLRIESNTWDEQLVSGYRGPAVKRVYRSFPSTGISVVAQGHGPEDEPWCLLRVELFASFRIIREGDFSTFEDLGPQRSPTLIVSWPGSTLKCFAPKRFTSGSDSRPQAAE